jgi:hypothetical protein
LVPQPDLFGEVSTSPTPAPERSRFAGRPWAGHPDRESFCAALAGWRPYRPPREEDDREHDDAQHWTGR